MELAKILADNLEYIKVNNIEKAMGLTKTALVRMIVRKEIPEKHKEKIEKWWNDWTMSLLYFGQPVETLPEELPNENIVEPDPEIVDNSEILKQIAAVKSENKPSWIDKSKFERYKEKKIAELKKQLK